MRREEGAMLEQQPISEMCPFTTNGHDIDKLLEPRIEADKSGPEDREKPHIKQQKYEPNH